MRDRDEKPVVKAKPAGDRKGKKPHKNKPTSQKWKKYTISGEKATKAKSCPRCGSGVFLAIHKDRMHCGKCSYTEFMGKAK